jgi:hypothetical protein
MADNDIKHFGEHSKDYILPKTELRECPFCGKSGYENLGVAVVEFPETHHNEYHVECGWCGAQGPENSISRNKAVELWNERI